MKNILIISTLVDNSIKELISSDDVRLFQSIEDVYNYTTTNALRVDYCYITRDVLGVATNTRLKLIMDLIENPFFHADEFIYVTEQPAEELKSIDYMIKDKNYTNWKIELGQLNRTYIYTYISGQRKSEEQKPRRKAIVRIDRDTYIKEKTKAGTPSEKYFTEEEELDRVTETVTSELQITENGKVCSIQIISGLKSLERDVFSYLFAQYLAQQKKVVIFEKDNDYLSLTSIVNSDKVNDVLIVDIDDIFEETKDTLNKINRTPTNIILISNKSRSHYSLDFVENLVYSYCSEYVDYIVTQKELNEIPFNKKFLTVVPNKIHYLLETLEDLDVRSIEDTQLVLLNMSSIRAGSIINTAQANIIISDVMQEQYSDTTILDINSINLGGEAHDMYMYIKS